MDEVLALADRITVLRLGATVASMAASEATHRDILGHMSGRAAAKATDAAAGETGRRQEGPLRANEGEGPEEGAVLRVEELVLRPASQAISMEVRPGTILGLAGLEGQGQVDFVESICGLRRPVSGRVVMASGGSEPTAVRNYRGANRLGIRYVPRDRRYEGLFGPLSVFENFAITLWGQFNRLGVLRRRAAGKRFEDFAQSSRLVSGLPRRPISTLSGGNQQKVLLGRWITMNPRVLVVNDPLRGVDANTKEELYGLFRRLAMDGVAIIYLSTEISELLTLTDQIAVFHEGSIAVSLPTETSSDTDVVAAMFGHGEVPGGDNG